MREAEVGQCQTCAHGREVASSRRSTFWRCDRSLTDPSYLKYPRLPVLDCRGYESRSHRGNDSSGAHQSIPIDE